MNGRTETKEKLKLIEDLFVKYGAVETEIEKYREESGERRIFEKNGSFFRTGVAQFDGVPFLLISMTDKKEFAEMGILEDIDAISIDADEGAVEKAVRCAFGMEAYPNSDI